MKRARADKFLRSTLCAAVGAVALVIALPASPAFPASPALPANPAVPASPALPANPAVPASPVHPASPIIPQIAARLDQARIAVGETAVLAVEVSWEGEASALDFDFPAPPDCRLLEVVGSSQASSAARTGAAPAPGHSRRYIFVLQAREKGEGRVGSATIVYRRPGESESHTLQSQPLDIAISSAGASIRRIPLVVLGLVFLVLAAVILRRPRKKRLRTAPAAPAAGAEGKAESLDLLAQAKKLKVEGDLDGYSRRLFQALALYLKERYSLDVNRENWRAAIDSPAAGRISDGSRSELAEIFRVLELARFGNAPEGFGGEGTLIKRIRSVIEAEDKKT